MASETLASPDLLPADENATSSIHRSGHGTGDQACIDSTAGTGGQAFEFDATTAAPATALTEEALRFCCRLPEGMPIVLISVSDCCLFHDETNCGSTCLCLQSGGTTVPLERETVRFVDNFSAGTRGSASAESVRGRHPFPI